MLKRYSGEPMATATVRVVLTHPRMGHEIPLPRQHSASAAGFDLAAAIDAPIALAVGKRTLVPCGFCMELPEGYEAQIRPRSGLANKFGITCLNTPGTIDADYRGEVHVLLINHGEHDFEIEPGMRIAQMVFAQLPQMSLELTDKLGDSERGRKGFGSTG